MPAGRVVVLNPWLSPHRPTAPGAAGGPSAAACIEAIGGPLAELTDLFDQTVALNVGIQDGRGTELHRQIAAMTDRLDRHDLSSAHDPRALDRRHADGAGSKHDDVRTGFDLKQAHGRGPLLRPCRREATVGRRYS
jgi:hypothetical protein